MPVAYASRAMTSAERNYAQIEKEQLGVVFACERFHSYIHGRTRNVETDHLPLIAISIIWMHHLIASQAFFRRSTVTLDDWTGCV